MTNNEAKSVLFNMLGKGIYVKDTKENQAILAALRALEQEPCEDWYDVPSDEMTLEQARQAVKDLRKMWAEHLWQEPCGKDINVSTTDAISRQAAKNAICDYVCGKDIRCVEEHECRMKKMISGLPPVQPKQKTGLCKDCKYFEYDSWAKVDGIPLIVAHEICSKWGRGCKTRKYGYCFLFEPQESEDEE